MCTGAVLACKPSAPVLSNPSMKGLNMTDSTTSWPWPRHGVEARRPTVPVICGECGTTHQTTGCPECGNPPDGLMVGVLRTEVTTGAGHRYVVRAERDSDTGGWVPTEYERLDPDSGSCTVWESRP
jgi:hypothetical protein